MHCEPYKQSSWSRARNSQENRPFLTASGVGTQSPTWTICFMRKGLEFAPQQMPGTQSQLGGLVGLVDWWGWWEADGKSDGELGLNSGPRALSPGHNHYTTQPHTHTRTHTHTHTTVGDDPAGNLNYRNYDPHNH